MSAGSQLLALCALAVVIAGFAAAGARVRALLLPGWSGAPARLAEALLALGLLVCTLQALGLAGLLGAPALALAAVLMAAAALSLGSGTRADPSLPPHEPPSRSLTALALVAALALVVQWVLAVQDSAGRGMDGFDTLWYHAPFAARFAQEGSIAALHFTDPSYLNWFYPQNSELLHAAGIALLDRDTLSPLLNLGWMALALLGAWCMGRPFGAGPACVLAVAALLATGTMVPREPGNAANDVGPLALLLCSGAVLVNAGTNGRPGRGALLVAGLAAGLALGTKLTVAPAVLALTVGVAWLGTPGARAAALGVWTAGMAATGGVWFARNLIHSGSPLPWFGELGPIALPGPGRGLEGRDPFTVAHYLLDGDLRVESDWFLPALDASIGFAWPALVALALIGMGLAAARGDPAPVRILGLAALAGIAGYLLTPLTASGPEGSPVGFGLNLRYAAPTLALALALLPLDPALRRDPYRAAITAGYGAAFGAVLLTADEAAEVWRGPEADLPAAIGIGLALLGLPFALAWARRRGRTTTAAAAAACALIASAALLLFQDRYLEDRYRRGLGYGLGEAAAWAQDRADQRIALAGTAAAFLQYGFYGEDASNTVQYLGEQGPGGDFGTIATCRAWRAALNAGGYDYLIVSGDVDLNRPRVIAAAPARRWAAGRNAHPVLRDGHVTVYRLSGDLDPDSCPRSGPSARKAGSRAESD